MPIYRLIHRIALRRIIGVALLCLILGQGTALVHAIAHAQQPADKSSEVADDWGHHAGTSACYLVDHLLTGQAPGAQRTTADRAAPAAVRVAAPATAIRPAPAPADYDARGPPGA